MNRAMTLMRRTRGGTLAMPIVHNLLCSSGRRLDRALREQPKFGHDFSNVRAYRDSVVSAPRTRDEQTGTNATPAPEKGPCPSLAKVGLLPVDPKIKSKSLCRGACGADCHPNSCEKLPDITVPLPAKTGQPQFACVYEVQKCGTHMGCRFHDECYDKAAEEGDDNFWLRRACDLEAKDVWGSVNSASWLNGGGPFDGYLYFSEEPVIKPAAETGGKK